jgi:hypothetical protein
MSATIGREFRGVNVGENDAGARMRSLVIEYGAGRGQFLHHSKLKFSEQVSFLHSTLWTSLGPPIWSVCAGPPLLELLEKGWRTT